MGTVMQLTAYGSGAERALGVAERELARLDAELSAQRTSSEIAKLNAGGACENEEVLRVLARALEIAERTDGAYDPTVYPLMQLWGFGTESAHVPQQTEISDALGAVGYEKLSAVTSPYALPSGMAVDLGGIGKGFAAQTVRRCLQKQGIQSAVLSLGGNRDAAWKQAGRCGLDRRAAGPADGRLLRLCQRVGRQRCNIGRLSAVF